MKTVDGSQIKYKFHETRNRVPEHIRGKQCFILTEGEALEEAKRLFGREKETVCLKIFFENLHEEKLEDFFWGSAWRGYSRDRTEEIGRISRLGQATTCQNWAWVNNYAPRVYGLLGVEREGKIFPAQLTEYIEGENTPSTMVNIVEVDGWMERIEEYMEGFGSIRCHKELIGSRDFIDGKLIDFQGFRFGPKVEGKVRDFLREKGKYGKGNYQSIPEIRLKGRPRDTTTRIKDMKLDELDFEGKSVLDLGCNAGIFCNYAAKRGAKRVLGVDQAIHVKCARLLSFYLGYHNNDYLATDITAWKPEEKFDYVFYFSMLVHTGYPPWLPEITKELLIIEENAKGSRFQTENWIAKLEQGFGKVEVVGEATDKHKGKPILYAWK